MNATLQPNPSQQNAYAVHHEAFALVKRAWDANPFQEHEPVAKCLLKLALFEVACAPS